jgi:hypothetical protein
MRAKSVLLAVTLALFTAATSTAFAVVEQHTDAKTGQAEAVKTNKSGAEKPVKSGRHAEEKTDTSAPFNLEDLFGCKPMGEDVHMLMPEPASGVKQQETMKPMQ